MAEGPAQTPATDAAALERENRSLTRRLSRLEGNVRHMEAFQDSNSRLLSKLVKDLEVERARSERLLLNVLPQRIIDRLNAGETLIADRHDDVTVLFSDFVGFTEISSHLPTAELIDELNDLFSGFDAICDATGVEKIKTIGDAYLAIGGLTDGSGDHPGRDRRDRVADGRAGGAAICLTGPVAAEDRAQSQARSPRA